jgi:hypothetical protein
MSNANSAENISKYTPSIPTEVEFFVQHIDSLELMFPQLMIIIGFSEICSYDKFERFAKNHGKLIHEGKDSKKYEFESPYASKASSLNEHTNRIHLASDIIPNLFIVALVSQFDAFLGHLLKSLFILKPELLVGSEKILTLSDLISLGTIENATNHILDKEIESVLRKSHIDQFSWMENKFSVKLKADLELWPIFVELTERRNLIAHTNGEVSDQYLSICKNNGVKFDRDYKKGELLRVSRGYFQAAYACLFEIGIKLSQVLWRKVRPDQIQDAENNLLRVTYKLLTLEKNKLAANLLDFALLTIKKFSCEEHRLMMIINRAQAYKWKGDENSCKEILSKQDWSACDLRFHLAVAVLNNEFSTAADLMKKMGCNPEVDYQHWPLFKYFIKTDEFLNTYLDIFGKPFLHIEEILRTEDMQFQKEIIKNLKEGFEKVAGQENLKSSNDINNDIQYSASNACEFIEKLSTGLNSSLEKAPEI